MKRYKSNYLFTPMFQLCNLFLSFFPGIFLMWLLLNPDEAEGVLYIFPMYLAIILFYVVFGNAIHFLISIFTKHKVFIDEDTITLRGKKIMTQSMKLEDVKFVIFEHGSIGKTARRPCSLSLYSGDYSQGVEISNPSFFMIVEINKRCKNAKFKFENYKWYIVWSIIFAAFALLLCIFG